METVLELVELTKAYPGGANCVRALDGVSLSMRTGEFVAIMGASGSGKSTLLHLAGGLDVPTTGAVRIEGEDLQRMSDRRRTLFRRQRLGFVFQSYNLLPTLSALENVLLPALIAGDSSRNVQDHARALLERVGLGHRLDHRPQALSGGEQQRVAIARALMGDPAIILADEPTGNLDAGHARTIWKLFRDLVRDEGRTLLAVTHESTGATFADRVVFLKDGRIIGACQPDGEDHAGMVATRYAQLVE
jgi:putative ABC transport system ATP-binding protein